jgi:small subunit ribosomal protein S16
MLKIRLNLRGKRGQRSFRIVVIDSRKKRDSGSYIADLGFYNPHTKEIKVDREGVQK